MTDEIVHDQGGRRFVLERAGRLSLLRYVLVDDHTVDIVSTWVHPELRGGVIGTRLVERALRWAEAQGLQVIPSCWFVAQYIDRNPRFQPLVAAPAL